jgi:hypothetical protein
MTIMSMSTSYVLRIENSETKSVRFLFALKSEIDIDIDIDNG